MATFILPRRLPPLHLCRSQFPKKIPACQRIHTHAPLKPSRLKLPPALSLFVAVSGLIYYATTLHTSPPPKTLNPQTFTSYTLVSKTPVASSPSQTAIYTLQPNHPSSALSFAKGILSVQIKQPQLQIARSYTPLPGGDGLVIRLLIKKEPGGEMSRYLFPLREGDTVFLRGPTLEYVYPIVDKTLFVAGGTGIAPALQLAAHSPSPRTEVLWAVRSRAETQGAMGEEVKRLVGWMDGRVSVRVFVDAEGGISMRDVEEGMGNEERVAVVVSGPEGFIRWISGEKVWREGREEQGRLGGIIRKVLEKRGGEVEVFKL